MPIRSVVWTDIFHLFFKCMADVWKLMSWCWSNIFVNLSNDDDWDQAKWGINAVWMDARDDDHQ